MGVRRRLRKVHIVSYVCEDCGTHHACAVGTESDGMCAICGSPMRIDELFSDRRFVTLPVAVERRDDDR